MKTSCFAVTFICCLLLSACGPQAPKNVSSAAAAAPATAVATAAPAPQCTLKLGFEAWEPYQFMSMDDQPAGLDIELVQAVATEMGCVISGQQGSWTDLIAALKAGEVDLLLGASVTPARQEFAYFSDPYRNEQFVLFVRSADVAGYPQTTLADFVAAGKKVGIISEYYYGEEFAGLYAQDQLKPQFVEASLGELNLARLIDEDIDGMLEDSYVGHAMLKRKGLAQQIGAHAISLGNNDVYVMFAKASVSQQQVEAFNQALATLKGDGRYNAILARYRR